MGLARGTDLHVRPRLLRTRTNLVSVVLADHILAALSRMTR